MRLDIIGSAGSYPSPDRACSSYLIRSDRSSILIDAGNGSQSKLYGVIEPSNLNGIVLSHSHLDHIADFVGIYHYLKYAEPPRTPVPVYANADTLEILQRLAGPGNFDRNILEFYAVEAGNTIAVNDLQICFYAAWHSVSTLISRISDGTTVICYGADGDLSEALAAASLNADLLLGESTWVEKNRNTPDGLHLDARSLALLAERSQVRELVITHIAHPGNRAKILDIATTVFRGTASLAEDGRTYWC